MGEYPPGERAKIRGISFFPSDSAMVSAMARATGEPDSAVIRKCIHMVYAAWTQRPTLFEDVAKQSRDPRVD